MRKHLNMLSLKKNYAQKLGNFELTTTVKSKKKFYTYFRMKRGFYLGSDEIVYAFSAIKLSMMLRNTDENENY